MSKISIITTTYKHEKFIVETIESILNQTFSDWELLIGDDSPDNNTWDIIQNYVNKYPDKIKAWHHKPNKGIVDNMNFLLGKVNKKTEYVAFLEGDDMYKPNNLEEKLKIFKKYKEVVLVYSDLSFIDKNNTVILPSFFNYRKIPFYKNSKISVNAFIKLKAGPIASWSTSIIKKDIIDQYKIISLDKNNIRYSVSDYDLYFRIATQNCVYGIDKPLTLYRRHQGNLSGGNGGTSADLDNLIDHYYNNKIIDKKAYNNKKSWTKIVCSIFDLEIGNKKGGYKNYIESFKYNVFSYPLYKITILVLLVLPKKLTSFILKKIIKRG